MANCRFDPAGGCRPDLHRAQANPSWTHKARKRRSWNLGTHSQGGQSRLIYGSSENHDPERPSMGLVQFVPETLRAAPGDKAFWQNDDTQPHWPGLSRPDGTIDTAFFISQPDCASRQLRLDPAGRQKNLLSLLPACPLSPVPCFFSNLRESEVQFSAPARCKSATLIDLSSTTSMKIWAP